MATSVFSVSTSDSPFETLDPCVWIEVASAPKRRAAISKLTRVRVDASEFNFLPAELRAELLEPCTALAGLERLALAAVDKRLGVGQ